MRVPASFARRVALQATFLIFAPLYMVVLVPLKAQAQRSASGRLRGTVTDSLHQQLAGARVQIPELSLAGTTSQLPELSHFLPA